MSQPWSTLFSLNRQVLMEKNLADITQSQADRPPAPHVNSVTWILTHLVEDRRWLLATLLRSKEPSTAPVPQTLPQLRAAMDDLQAALGEAFDAVVDWSEPRLHPAMQISVPLDQIVGTFLMEEAYHLGQIGTARKLMGLPGAIKAPETAKA
jgi:uncharacterized damage-inducible protein DinB